MNYYLICEYIIHNQISPPYYIPARGQARGRGIKGVGKFSKITKYYINILLAE
jgi:hypothetical protein